MKKHTAKKAKIKPSQTIKGRLKQVSPAFFYFECKEKTGCGIGFLNCKGPHEMLIEYESDGISFEGRQISLSEAADWVVKMLFAESKRGGDCMQAEDEGQIRLFEILRDAVA